MIIIALVFAAVGVEIVVEHFRFRARKAEGEVIEVLERQSWSSSGSSGQGRRTTQYIPVFRVTDSEGLAERIESTQGSSDLNLPIGSRHTILIDHKRPGTGRPISNGAFLWGGMCVAAAIFVFVVDWYGIMG